MTQVIPHDERVLVLLPTARDGERLRTALVSAGLSCTLCMDMAELCREIAVGAGAALLTEETLAADQEQRLAAVLHTQPAWSDLPLLVLARKGAARRPLPLRDSINLSLVERPVRLRSLLSVVQAALRSRHQQYKVRTYLTETERQAATLRDKEERLQFALAAGKLGAWDVDLITEQIECSALGRQNFGRPPAPRVQAPEPSFPYEELFDSVHPGDRERVQTAFRQAIAERTGYDIEYRTLWPDGTTHWILARGQATYGPEGSPLHMRGVLLDITDRRRDEEALREAARRKDDFLALLAHELRNPLAPIRNGLQVMCLTQDPEIQRRSQQMMERQLGHMVRLIDDLLDVSRINRNKMDLRIVRIALADAVSSAVETARPMIERGGHELILSFPAEPIFLDADLTRLAQVFANLLTNSAKYTQKGGRIVLTVSRDGDKAVVAVKDSGIGIPAGFLPTIFDMFSQVDRSVERTTGGLGIGLSLVKGLVEMHGGTVTAASDGPGMGSEFTVRLPAPATGSEAAPSAEPALDANPIGRRWRILVVDDNRDSAESMVEMLRLLGNEVAVAYDGIDAVEQTRRFRPQIILMDIGMPRLNGLDATRRIREEPGGSATIIIALSGWGQSSDRLRSSEAGCDGHLVKPVSIQDLSRLLANPKAPPSPS